MSFADNLRAFSDAFENLHGERRLVADKGAERIEALEVALRSAAITMRVAASATGSAALTYEAGAAKRVLDASQTKQGSEQP